MAVMPVVGVQRQMTVQSHSPLLSLFMMTIISTMSFGFFMLASLVGGVVDTDQFYNPARSEAGSTILPNYCPIERKTRTTDSPNCGPTYAFLSEGCSTRLHVDNQLEKKNISSSWLNRWPSEMVMPIKAGDARNGHCLITRNTVIGSGNVLRGSYLGQPRGWN